MEQWSFPPKFDNNYFPPADSRYWFPNRETMPAGDRNLAILKRLQEVCAYAYETSAFYKSKWDGAGFHPSQLKTFEDFEAKVPVIKKSELRASQSKSPPFGEYLCISESEVFHIHGTSGTTGQPTAFAIGRDDWDVIANAHARVMWAMGMRPNDTICIAAIFSLYMGSWGALAGAERLNAKAFPFGAGATGMSARFAHWLDSIKPAGFYSTPTYALHLAQTAIDNGLNPGNFGLRYMFFSGEPGASIPSVREKIEDLYDAKVFDSGSMAEMSPWMHVGGSFETQGMICWQDIVYTEVCDPNTHLRVPYGSRGTPVYTHLERTSQPMIRLESGDLTMWEEGPTPCGRTYPHLPLGIIGRIDDMFTIRGENVYPSEIDAALNKLAEYGGEHRILITRVGLMDECAISVEASNEVWKGGKNSISQYQTNVEGQLQRLLGLRTIVEVVEPKSLQRTDFKARRVIDDREVLREMKSRLESSSS